jgi:type IV pilus assembly protein PilB
VTNTESLLEIGFSAVDRRSGHDRRGSDIKKPVNKKIGEILVDNLVPQQYIDYALKEQKVRKKPIGQILIEESLVNPEVFAQALSEQIGLEYFSIFMSPIQEDISRNIDLEFVRETECVPIKAMGEYIAVGITDPLDLNKKDNIARYFRQNAQKQIFPYVISTETFHRYLESLIKIDEKEILSYLSEHDANVALLSIMVSNDKQAQQKQHEKELHASEALRLLLKKAIVEKASDIHIEPSVGGGKIKLRKNGLLSVLVSLNEQQYIRLINIIRLESNVNIVDRHLPQDGRIDGAYMKDEKHNAVDFRVSIIPNQKSRDFPAESIVIRVLDKRTSVLPLSRLGMNSYVLSLISNFKNKSHGMIIFTGPTGSGKTTTIYSTMATINSLERAVVTVEDPVEYRNYLWKQIQVNEKTKFTFSRALKSILRHDPDIIFCGEMRDEESARITFDMANTGHLVFTTLHANDSVKSIPRLLSLGVPSSMIESSVLGIVSQRLARISCPLCKGKGCSACNHSGHSGRTMISEIFPINYDTHDVLKMAVRGEIIDARKSLTDKGIVDLRRDAEEKNKQNIISREEIERVV